MPSLIALSTSTIGADKVQTVNARELHAFLESRADFSTWIKERVEQYGFTPGLDFTTFPSTGGKGRPRQEYALTIDMAKELAMVERNDKGREARRYFIECERQLRAQPREAQSVPSAVRLVVAGHGVLAALPLSVGLPAFNALSKLGLPVEIEEDREDAQEIGSPAGDPDVFGAHLSGHLMNESDQFPPVPPLVPATVPRLGLYRLANAPSCGNNEPEPKARMIAGGP